MRGKIRIHNPERLDAYVMGPDRSEDFKALVLKLVDQIGDVQEVVRLTGVPRSTIYRWIQVWNCQEDLTNRRGQGGGRKPKLSAEAWEKVRERLGSKEAWTLKEVQRLLEEEFGVSYHEDHLRRLLRRLGMRYGKPYVMDYRRPQEAETLLAERVRRVFEELEAQGIRPEEIAIGFVDETSPQNTANSQRLWSFGPFRLRKNTDRMRVNAVGFYALKGNDVLEFLERSKAEDVAAFLRRVREANRAYRVVVVIWDNFASHRSRQVRAEAERLGIHLVYLPPYSPDLNPIEQIWRVIKRKLSALLVKSLEEMKDQIRQHFQTLVRRLSFCRAWITHYFNPAWNAVFHS